MAAAATADKQVDLSTIPVSPEGSHDASSNQESEPVTVFHNPNEFNVKHPLQNRWTLWFTKPATGKVRLLKV